MEAQNTQPPRRSALRRGLIAASLVGSGIAIGAGGLAFAAAGEGMGWHGMGWHHARIGMFQHMVRGALENVGATTAQEDKIHDIIAATYTEFDKDKANREAIRKQALELMKAPTLDRASIEKLRADKISEIDAKSKKIVGALLDAASQLSPEQRAKLVQHVEERMAHRGWGPNGWGPGGWGGGRHHDRMDGPDGPERGPDGDHG